MNEAESLSMACKNWHQKHATDKTFFVHFSWTSIVVGRRNKKIKGWHYRQSTSSSLLRDGGLGERVQKYPVMGLVCVCGCATKGVSIHARGQRRAPGLGTWLQGGMQRGMCRAAGGSWVLDVLMENGVSQPCRRGAFRKSWPLPRGEHLNQSFTQI